LNARALAKSFKAFADELKPMTDNLTPKNFSFEAALD
jgi:hypothetical protein